MRVLDHAYNRGKAAVKELLAPVLYRHMPPIGLEPERLMAWHQAIIGTRDVPGAVLEIGCSAGGTTAFSRKLQRNIGDKRHYVCVDTFSGFVPDHFDRDVKLGNNPAFRNTFSANSMRLVRRSLDRHGAFDVRLVQGDICTVDDDQLPELVSCCLIDVDLAYPVLEALNRIYPRLGAGGTILVDDCHGRRNDWQARIGYEQFIAAHGLHACYSWSMGVVRAALPDGSTDNVFKNVTVGSPKRAADARRSAN